MNSFKDLVQRRRSIRKFTDQELSQEQVVTLMRAALMSPSSKSSKGWQFVVVDDKETLQALSTCKAHGATLIAQAALAVVVVADPMVSNVWIEDASIASLMIQLQAEDMGLGSCWVQVRGRSREDGTSSDEYIHALLDLPLQLQTLCVIAVGHKAAERPPIEEESLQWEKVHINKYGGQ